MQMHNSVSVKDISEVLGVKGHTVTRRANKENWPYQESTVRGGKKRLYILDSLPSEIRNAIAMHRVAEELNQQTALEQARLQVQQLEKSIASHAGKQRQEQTEIDNALFKHKRECDAKFNKIARQDPKYLRAKARQWAVIGYLQLFNTSELSKQKARAAFANKVNQREVAVPPNCIEWLPKLHGRHDLSAGTLKNWEYAYQQNGLWGLTDNYGTRKGQSKIETNDDLKHIVLGALISYPHITAKKIKQFLAAEHPSLNIVSEKTISRFVTNWKHDNQQSWTFMSNPDKWKNIYMSAAGSHFERINELNQLWEMDSTPGDWLLEDGRHSVIGVVDMWSRRLKFYVSKTSKASAICQLFRRAVLDWGVPKGVRTDNGADYVSDQFSGVLRDMDINHELCIPFASEEKGTIERAMRTMSHGILDLLPGFIGHSVAERKVIEARKSFADRIMKSDEVVEVSMTSEALQELLDKWTEHVYLHDEHGGLKGKTPFEMVHAWTEPLRFIDDERALDMLLAEVAGTRTVSKKGIRFNNYTYFNDALFSYVGRDVLLKYDEQDMGRLYAYCDGEFIGEMLCHELIGISRQEAASAAKAKQKKFVTQQAKELREYRKAIVKDIPQAVIEHRISQSKQVASFPKRGEVYTSKGLEESAKAVDVNQLTEQPKSAAEKAITKRVIASLTQPVQHEPSISEMDSRQKFHYWNRLNKRVESGEQVSEQDRRFHLGFQTTAAYRAEKRIHEEFSLDIEGELNAEAK